MSPGPDANPGAPAAPGATSVVTDSAALLDRWRQRYADRPHEERIRLLLLALEREQIVAVAYREDTLGGRINALGLPPEATALMRRALLWAWKDEQVHAEYVRGLLLSSRRPVPAAIVFGRQAVGTVSGWVTSVRHHEDPATAPMRTAAAGAVVLAGRLAGRISPELAAELRFRTLRRYLELNVALERTAELAYVRLAEVARHLGNDEEATTFARIALDEAGHGRAFTLLAGALTTGDRWAPHARVDDVALALVEVSPWFVAVGHRPGPRPDAKPATDGRAPTVESHPRPGLDAGAYTEGRLATRPGSGSGGGRPRPAHRAGGAPGGGLASGAPVVVHAMAGPNDDPTAITRTALDDADLAALVWSGARVAIRTSFMFGYDRRDRSNVAEPRLVAAVAAACRDAGATDVAVLEARTVYGHYFARRSVPEVAAYFGFADPGYRVVDIDDDLDPWEYERGVGRRTICRTWRDADVRIVVAKIRSDPTEHAHLCLATMEGSAGRHDETVHPGRVVDFRTATMMTLDAAPPDLAVVDGTGPVADGPFGVMGCRRPAQGRRVYAGRDALGVDVAVLDDLGLGDASRSPIVRTAAAWFGADLTPPEVVGDRGAPDGFRGPTPTAWHRVAAWFGYPVYVYLGGRGKRFVPQMDVAAFPPRGRVDGATRFTRWAGQRAFGLRPP